MGDPAALAKTLITSDTGKQALHHFFEGYLDYVHVASIDHSGINQFGALRSDMVKETRAFIDDVVFQKRATFSDLLTSPTTNPSRALADTMASLPQGNDYGSVTRPTGRGVGLLAQGSILASRAQPDASVPHPARAPGFLALALRRQAQSPGQCSRHQQSRSGQDDY